MLSWSTGVPIMVFVASTRLHCWFVWRVPSLAARRPQERRPRTRHLAKASAQLYFGIEKASSQVLYDVLEYGALRWKRQKSWSWNVCKCTNVRNDPFGLKIRLNIREGWLFRCNSSALNQRLRMRTYRRSGKSASMSGLTNGQHFTLAQTFDTSNSRKQIAFIN